MSISVIIPAYNEEKYLEKTLQALSDVETIVVCNGCTDKTAEIAEKYTKKVLVLEKRGVSHARNIGAKAASHQRIVFLDADILVEEGLLQKIEESTFSVGTCKVKADSSLSIDKMMMGIKTQMHRFGYCTGLIFCDKDIFFQAGGFEEDISTKEDGRFLRRAKKGGNYGIVNGYVYNNMRRFRKRGYFAVCWFWIKEYLFPQKRDYESVR